MLPRVCAFWAAAAHYACPHCGPACGTGCLAGNTACSPGSSSLHCRKAGGGKRRCFLRKLNAGKKVIAIELDSPKDADLTGYLDGARRLQAAGADLLTIADCPIARARMDSSLVACRVHRELGLNVLPHMTCRDRNLNATKALLLGLYAEGVREVLAITGDPSPPRSGTK